MDWLRAGLTAGAVLMVMFAARRCGPRLAGVIAALPTVTAPALGWLAHDRGPVPAISAAIASVSVCSMLAAFAFSYAIVARRAGPLVALVSGVAGAALMSVPALAAVADLRHALSLAFASCALACMLLPRSDAGSDTDRFAFRCSPYRTTCVAVATGVLTALVTLLGSTFSSFTTGLLASLPLVSGGVLITTHVTEGSGAALEFLRGYAWGLFGKIMFGTAFALLVPQLGVTPAMLLACSCAVLVSMIRQPSAFVIFRPWPRAVVDPASR